MNRSYSLVLLATTLFALPAHAATPKSPELETLQIAKLLKPIPDEDWKKIAGDRAAQNYEIAKGDTLYDISNRLFGDPKYWPKIWALNNGKITNPHFILPGHSIAFMPGTGTSLPGVTVAENEEDTAQNTATDVASSGRPDEWKRLPPQEWESVTLAMPPEVDPLGFDRRSRVKSHGATSYDLALMVASQKIQPFGLLFGSEKESNFIGLEEIVFIHKEGDLQVGQTYSIAGEPEQLDPSVTNRTGYSYQLLGKVKILMQRDGAYVGVITNAAHVIERGNVLVPLEPRVPEMTPIPGPNSLEGVVLIDHRASTTQTSQNRLVFIDRGSDDGVSPGMVFRSYTRTDPNNGKSMTNANVLIDADIMVVQVSPRFCQGMIIRSYSYVAEGANAVLLTDVSDLIKKHDPNELRLDYSGAVPPDELDALDNGQGLKDSEKRELRQLEKWKENPATPAPLPAPTEEAIPAPTEAVPPPTEETPPTAPAPEVAPPNEAPVPDQNGGDVLPPAPPSDSPPQAPSNETAPELPSEDLPPPPPM